jgi:hypothetical protein
VDADKVATEYFHTRNPDHAGIAPSEDILLPKGYKPPIRKDAAKPTAKKKRIAAAQKKRWADAKVTAKAAKKVVKK